MTNNFYKQNFIIIETAISFVLGFIIYLIGNYFLSFNSINENFVFTRIQSLIGLLGFLITTLSIIFSLKDGPKLEKLQKSGQYHNVINIYINTIKRIGIRILVRLGIKFINSDDVKIVDGLVLSINVTLLSIKLFRCIWITNKLFTLTIPSKDSI
ncbi:MAG: hypothetical protein PHR61_03555 [Candidatus Absconditabacteria bacterium]|nr:hypothetical protein [Candidatus Absconditabacteria bacterium]